MNHAPDNGPADSVESYVSNRGNAFCVDMDHERGTPRIIPHGQRYYVADCGEVSCEACMVRNGWSLDEIDPEWEPDYDDRND